MGRRRLFRPRIKETLLLQCRAILQIEGHSMTATIQQPKPLGLKKSFGFGDRLGLATPGQLSAARKYDFAPIFAQQSIREMERTQRTPREVMDATKAALAKGGFSGDWGADADHLKAPEHVDRTAAVGFCFFTI